LNYPAVDPQMPELFAARATIHPGHGHNFHCHPGRAEIIHVLEGTIAQWVAKDRQVMHPGDTVLIPADIVHASFNIADEPAVLFVVLSKALHEAPLAIDVAGIEPWCSLPSP